MQIWRLKLKGAIAVNAFVVVFSVHMLDSVIFLTWRGVFRTGWLGTGGARFSTLQFGGQWST